MHYEQIQKRFLPMSETMFFILFSLLQERHGYGIMQHVHQLTNGRITLGAGTVYQSLGKLEDARLIRPVQEIDRKKTYVITDCGRTLLQEEARRIREICGIMEGWL